MKIIGLRIEKYIGKDIDEHNFTYTDKMFDDSSILVSELDEGSKVNKIYTPVKKAESSGKTGLSGFNINPTLISGIINQLQCEEKSKQNLENYDNFGKKASK